VQENEQAQMYCHLGLSCMTSKLFQNSPKALAMGNTGSSVAVGAVVRTGIQAVVGSLIAKPVAPPNWPILISEAAA
jgi:hypothetical protein